MKTPVTQGEYAQFIRETSHAAPFVTAAQWQSYHLTHPYSHVQPYLWQHNQPLEGREDHPVVLVNWYDAQAYARWLAQKTG